MGSNDKESTEVAEYHTVRVKRGGVAFSGWLTHSPNHVYIKQHAAELIAAWKRGALLTQPAMSMYSNTWVLYPGPKPNKKWGPVCP